MYFEDRELDYELVTHIRGFFIDNPEATSIDIPRMVEGIDPNTLSTIWSQEDLLMHALNITRGHSNNMSDRDIADYLSQNGSYKVQ